MPRSKTGQSARPRRVAQGRHSVGCPGEAVTDGRSTAAPRPRAAARRPGRRPAAGRRAALGRADGGADLRGDGARPVRAGRPGQRPLPRRPRLAGDDRGQPAVAGGIVAGYVVGFRLLGGQRRALRVGVLFAGWLGWGVALSLYFYVTGRTG